MQKPDFFIVGAPKCGTTSMAEYLRRHPDIFLPDRKETMFFGKDLLAETFLRNREEYLALFEHVHHKKRLGEASVWYLYSQQAAREISQFTPDAKIVIMLRNPVDMLYSLHSHFLWTGNEDIQDFGAAIDAQEQRKQGCLIPRLAYFSQGLQYLDVALYAQQVRRYQALFAQENIHIVIFDDFTHDTPGEYRRMLEFLDVDQHFQPTFEVFNPNKMARSKLVRNLLLLLPKINTFLGRPPLPRFMHTLLIKQLRNCNTRYGVRPAMEAAVRQRLQAYFVSDVEKLSSLIGRDLTFWVRGTPKEEIS